MIALTLSGGGSRAIAFHLGCLRALNDRGILEKISVISAVSGGSVIAGMYAYNDESFEEFDRRVVSLLRKGLQKSSVVHMFSPRLFMGIVATNLFSRPIAAFAAAFGRLPPLRRWYSRSDALEAALEDLFKGQHIQRIARPKIEVVFNACELRTGTAFRFGNRRSGTWRLGEIKGNNISVAHAIACSAAYPLILPAFDREYTFVKKDSEQRHRVTITDGGVYDNLGISCVEPNRDPRFNLHSYKPDHIVCCHAGYGQLSGEKVPFGLYSRLSAAFEANFRKVQDASLNRLHMLKYAGNIKSFVLPYLGQQDTSLPFQPPHLIRRDEVIGYPTNFCSMPDSKIDLISRRGEQLTHLLLSHYCPEM
jgi:NTE family protein